MEYCYDCQKPTIRNTGTAKSMTGRSRLFTRCTECGGWEWLD